MRKVSKAEWGQFVARGGLKGCPMVWGHGCTAWERGGRWIAERRNGIFGVTYYLAAGVA